MGALSRLDSHHRLAYPITPPELVSPSSSTYSSRPSEEASVSPLMSNYEPVTTAEPLLPGAMSDSSSRPPLQGQRPPQQQLPKLPPLSSILTMAQDSIITHSSSYDERRSYPTGNSPMDRPHTSTSVPSRPYSPSYFQTNLPGSSLSRDNHPPHDRNPFHLAARRSFPGPLSPPHHREAEHRRADRTPDYGPPQHDIKKEDYSPNSRYASSAYRGQPDRYPPAPGVSTANTSTSTSLSTSTSTSTSTSSHGIKREYDHPSGPASYSDAHPRTAAAPLHAHHHHHHHHHHAAPSPPTTASTVVSSDGLPSKDGLGPKIWTGTHFLPRFVRAADVPGEGMCYFYDDGSHCKTVIDGEAVNAHWGVTKAGKPRKRLAIACVTCREKKIKCDPDYPRCVQCDKFGRICKFKNAPRGGSNTSPSTPPAELPVSADRDVRPRSTNSSASVSPRTVPAAAVVERDIKRHRYTYEADYSQHPRLYDQRQQQPRAFAHPPTHYSHTPPPPPSQQQQQQHQSYPPLTYHLHPPPPRQQSHSHAHHDNQPMSAERRSPMPLPLPLPLPSISREVSKTPSSGMPWHQPELPRIQ